MRNYKLDATLLPEVWLTWTSKDGRIWANKNGKRQNHPEPWMFYDSESDLRRRPSLGCGRTPFGNTWATQNSSAIWVNSGSQLNYAYAKYHKDIDRLEIAAVKYDTTRGEYKHEWSFDGDRFFIGKDKSVINQDGIVCTDRFQIRQYYTVRRAKDMIKLILRLSNNQSFVEEFKKFIGHDYFTIGNGTSTRIEYAWHISRWYETVQKTRSKGKAQQLTDKLVSMPLSEINDLSYKYPSITTPGRFSRTIKNVVYFERVNDEWSVLRALMRDEDNMLHETWRVYLSDDGTNRIVSKSGDDWVPSKQPSSYSSMYYLANVNEAKEKCNRIKYILPLFEENLVYYDINRMITILRFPEIEQLYKMGFTKLADNIARSSTPKATLKDSFGGYYNEKENGVLRKIGMTKYQLDKYYQSCDTRTYHYYCSNNKSLEMMRKIFGNDLSHIDNNTYDEYLSELNKARSDMWHIECVDIFGIDRYRFWKSLIKISKRHPDAYRLVNDSFSSYRYLRNKPEVNWIFDDYSDIIRLHDVVVALKNEEERERRAYWNMAEAERRKKDEENRQKTDEKRKCYEYEEDEFIIRLPKNTLEIINEGSAQKICIGGYTSRHGKGDTNLFFLRKKNDEDTPFYAIEMNNDKCIVQIHGFGNKWLGNNPEAIPTVIRWLRKNGIKCDDKILTCKATGYGARNDYVPMPIVD